MLKETLVDLIPFCVIFFGIPIMIFLMDKFSK